MKDYIIQQILVQDLETIIQNSIKKAVAESLRQSTPQATDPEPFIKGIHRLAKYLGISPTMAQKLKNEGIFECFQYDKTLLFDKQKIKEALANYNKKTQ
jgi:hypothetical protein